MSIEQTPPRAFDADAGASAFQQVEPLLRAMPAADLVAINANAQELAIAALALVDVAREPARLTALSMLPSSLFAADTIDQLETNALALWHAHVKLQTESAHTQGAKVDVAVYEASGRHLGKMLKLIEYHMGNVPPVAVELADIKSGSGYQDRASDLVRAAALFDAHRAELQDDARYFSADDASVARGYAQTILDGVRASMGKSAAEWSDLRSRAHTRVVHLYGELKSAGEFVFRGQPEHRDRFVALRQVVVPTRARAKAEN
jgi:hypothetical protein